MDFEDIVQGGESKTLEFILNLDKTRRGLGRIADTIAAFANTEGGCLIFGIDDGGEIVGISNDDLVLSQLTKFVTPFLSPIPKFSLEFHRHQEKLLGVIEVKKSEHIITSRGGKPPIRRGTVDVYRNVEAVYQSKIDSERVNSARTIIRVLVALEIAITLIAFVDATFLSSAFGLVIAASLIIAILSGMNVFVIFRSAIAIGILRKRVYSLIRKILPVLAFVIIALEFVSAYFWFGFDTSQIFLLVVSNLAIYLILGALNIVPTSRLIQWGGLFLMTAFVGLGLILAPNAEGFSSIIVELSGVFVGILGALSLSEIWKAIEDKRKGREIELRLIDELDSIQESILQLNTAIIEYPVWNSVSSNEVLLLINRDVLKGISSAYQAVESFISHPTEENKTRVLDRISRLTRED